MQNYSFSVEPDDSVPVSYTHLNIEALPNRFIYTERQARSVHVASQGIVEALRRVYGAGDLLKELGF